MLYNKIITAINALSLLIKAAGFILSGSKVVCSILGWAQTVYKVINYVFVFNGLLFPYSLFEITTSFLPTIQITVILRNCLTKNGR